MAERETCRAELFLYRRKMLKIGWKHRSLFYVEKSILRITSVNDVFLHMESISSRKRRKEESGKGRAGKKRTHRRDKLSREVNRNGYDQRTEGVYL